MLPIVINNRGGGIGC